MIRIVLPVLLALALPAGADPGAAAREAADRIAAAAERLAGAEGARDRIEALTEAVRAYEAGLATLREGLRALAVGEAALTRDLAAREGRTARLLAALVGIERMPAPLFVLHPDGPLGAARAAMLMGDAAPALETEAAILRADLDRLATLRALEAAAMSDLEAGLAGVQSAREALSAAIADRAPLPRASDGGVAALAARARTLRAFAEGLSEMPPAATPRGLDLPLPLPADARLLRRFEEPDAAGVVRPGWVMATAPGALLTAPTQASVRYAGPLLDYGLVIVLEPSAGALMVLAGLAEAYVRAGEIVAAGAPLGLMGGTVPRSGEFRDDAVAGGGASGSEALYVETRVDGRPVDPASWFAAELGTSEGSR